MGATGFFWGGVGDVALHPCCDISIIAGICCDTLCATLCSATCKGLSTCVPLRSFPSVSWRHSSTSICTPCLSFCCGSRRFPVFLPLVSLLGSSFSFMFGVSVFCGLSAPLSEFFSCFCTSCISISFFLSYETVGKPCQYSGRNGRGPHQLSPSSVVLCPPLLGGVWATDGEHGQRGARVDDIVTPHMELGDDNGCGPYGQPPPPNETDSFRQSSVLLGWVHVFRHLE